MAVLLGAAYMAALAGLGALAYVAGKRKGERDRDKEP
jgi:hypothetical protein